MENSFGQNNFEGKLNNRFFFNPDDIPTCQRENCFGQNNFEEK
jgi:hypothetical protein